MTAPETRVKLALANDRDWLAFVLRPYRIQVDGLEQLLRLLVCFHQMRLETPRIEMTAWPMPSIEPDGDSGWASGSTRGLPPRPDFGLPRRFPETAAYPNHRGRSPFARCPARRHVIDGIREFHSNRSRHTERIISAPQSAKCKELTPCQV